MISLNIFTSFCECWWLPWLLPLLLGALLAWAIRSHWKNKYSDLEATAQGLRKNIAILEEELENCGKDRTKLKGDLALCEGRYRELEQSLRDLEKDNNDTASGGTGADLSGLGAVAVSSLTSDDGDNDIAGANVSGETDKYAKLSSDNLQIIEGIGPKMESVLKENGISSWAVLAGKSHGELKAILDKYGDKYRIIDPSDWMVQANLANNRDFDGLIAHQKADGSESKAEKLFIKLGIIKSYQLNDLKAIEGIGPKIEVLLNEAGINTWRELSTTSVERLESILEAAGARYKLADPSSWPKQAEYAADGDWDALEKYQDFLDGGKTPT